MERCLYTYSELNKNCPPNESTASREHIVPYAIGGSDHFAIDYCSKKANNDFGRDIDAPSEPMTRLSHAPAASILAPHENLWTVV